MWWRLGPQVLKLLRRGVAAEYFVAVRVATEARYDVARCPGLRNPELGPRPEVGRRVGRFLLSVANAALVEGEVLRVSQRKPEEKRSMADSLRSIPNSMPSTASRRAFSSCE